MTAYVDKSSYEVFEIHKLPRGLVALTLCIAEHNAEQYVLERGLVKIPINSLTVHIGKTENIPDKANFVYISKYLGYNNVRYSTTKSFRIIHKRIKAIKDALDHSNLDIYINEELIQPYKVGTRYLGKGMYIGIVIDNIKGVEVKYHYFNDNVTGIYKEYINDVTPKST